MYKKILILGGAGFIGGNVTERLVRDGCSVRVFTRSGRSIGQLAPVLNDLELIYGDFMDEYALGKAVEGVDCVLHLITTTFPNTSKHSGIYDIQTNLIPTVRLLELCEQHHVKKLVYLSSGGTVYGEPLEIPIKETHPLNPISIYGSSKKLIESYMEFFNNNSSIDIDILRVSNPYGPGQNLYGAQGLIAVACAHLLDGREFPVIGDGTAIRDYLFISDLVDAMRLAMKHEGSMLANVSSGVGTTVNEILDTLERVSGKKFKRKMLPERKDFVRRSVLCNERAKTELDWNPNVSLEEGLSQTWNWALKQLNK